MKSQINRKEFIEVLNKIKPALSTQDFLPVLSSFCFSDDFIYAYNDVMAISFPNETKIEFEGAIAGNRLLKILNSFSSEFFTYKVKNNDIQISSGKSNIKLPFLKEDEFVWDSNSKKHNIELEVDDDFIKGLKLCLISISQDVMHPEHQGIQLSCEDDDYWMHSTDNQTISKYKLKNEPADFDPVILPEAFCNQLISLYDDMEEPCLFINKDSIRVIDEDSEIILFSKLIYNGDGTNFSDIISKYKKSFNGIFFSTKNNGFIEALERALIINGDEITKKTNIVFSNGILNMNTQTERGHVEDVIKMGKKVKDRQKIEIGFSTDLILRASKLLDTISFNKDIILFKHKDNFLHLVAPLSGD